MTEQTLAEQLQARIAIADRVAAKGLASNVMVYVPFDLAERILAALARMVTKADASDSRTASENQLTQPPEGNESRRPTRIAGACRDCGTTLWTYAEPYCGACGSVNLTGGEWRDIETAPKDGTRFLVWNGYRRAIAWFSRYSDMSSGWHHQNIIGEPLGKRDIEPETHWMLFPPPPRSDDSPAVNAEARADD